MGEPASDDPLSRRPDAPAPNVHVTLLLETDDTAPPLAGWLESQLARLAQLAGVAAGELTLVVVDDPRMSALHQQYHGDPATTDVLSFDLRDESAGQDSHASRTGHSSDQSSTADPVVVEGDLVICLDEAHRQANQRGHDVRLEVLLYALHGLLHLLGMDDHNPAEAAQMHRREDELLTQAGFGPVYGQHHDGPTDGQGD